MNQLLLEPAHESTSINPMAGHRSGHADARQLNRRPPLRILFVNTSLPVGGAETLLLNLVRGLDREQFLPEICCLKEPGPIGETLSREVPVHSRLLRGKYDLAVLGRLVRLIQRRHIAAVVTFGAGDKMFWGRLAARLAKVPVILSALHSTGWPDVIRWPNRALTWLTDGFIGVAPDHGTYLVEREGFPARKVFVIHNGVDTTRFAPRPDFRQETRSALGLSPDVPVCGIVAALRPEKNHHLFLQVAANVAARIPNAQFVIVGDGPLRAELVELTQTLGLTDRVHFTGPRADIERLLPAFDLFSLTSRMEANPVSILEALSCGVPVVAPRVGSIPATVISGQTGLLVPAGDEQAFTEAWCQLLSHPELSTQLGSQGRDLVERTWSLRSMITGYQDLIASIFARKLGAV